MAAGQLAGRILSDARSAETGKDSTWAEEVIKMNGSTEQKRQEKVRQNAEGKIEVGVRGKNVNGEQIPPPQSISRGGRLSGRPTRDTRGNHFRLPYVLRMYLCRWQIGVHVYSRGAMTRSIKSRQRTRKGGLRKGSYSVRCVVANIALVPPVGDTADQGNPGKKQAHLATVSVDEKVTGTQEKWGKGEALGVRRWALGVGRWAARKTGGVQQLPTSRKKRMAASFGQEKSNYWVGLGTRPKKKPTEMLGWKSLNRKRGRATREKFNNNKKGPEEKPGGFGKGSRTKNFLRLAAGSVYRTDSTTIVTW